MCAKMYEWQYGKLKIHDVALLTTISYPMLDPDALNRNRLCSFTLYGDIDKNEQLKNAF